MRLVKGVLERCLEVLELLAADARGMRLSDIASRLDLPKGPTHRLLAELCEQHWVEQDASTDQYRLTLKLSLLGAQYLHGTGLPGLVQPILDGVAAQCRELVRVTVVEGRGLAWLASAQGAAPGLMYQPAMTGAIALHATANGKAWLATMSDEDATRYALQGGLGKRGPWGPRAVKTVGGLIKELHATRKRGYGVALEEAEPGVGAIAVAIRAGVKGPAVGTMSVAGPLLRVGPARHEEFHGLLRNAAETLGSIWPRGPALEEKARWTASASKV